MIRTLSPARLAAGAAAFGLVLAGLAARPVAAQTPPKPSPEELAIGLLPYQLTASDLPAGFQIAGIAGVTPAQRAFDLSNSADEGQMALDAVSQAGILAGFEQVIAPKDATPLRLFSYEVVLFDSSDDASSYLRNTLDQTGSSRLKVDNPPLSVQFGDESGALHTVRTFSDGTAEGDEYIYWRRGRIFFRMAMGVPDLTETIDQVVPFAQAADARAATVTPPAPVTQATLPVTSSEAVRVAAAYALYDRLPRASLAPYGMQAEDPTVISNADLILNQKDPKAAFAPLIGNTGRIVGVERLYDTLQGDGNDSVAVRYVLSASRQGAQAELQNPFAGDATVQVTGTYALPQPLGDAGALVEGTATHEDGSSATLLAAVWTHGDVVLEVVALSPSADITIDQVTAFAATVDAGFTNGPLPAVLTNPSGAGQSAPAASPTAPANPVQAWSARSLLAAPALRRP